MGLPQTFQNNVQGICGNWDGNAVNDMTTKEGELVGPHDYTALGNSWQSPGAEGDG